MSPVSRYPAEHRYPRHPNDSPDYPGSTIRARQLRVQYPFISTRQAFSMACIEIRPDRNGGARLVGFDARDRPVYESPPTSGDPRGLPVRNAHTKGAEACKVTEPVRPAEDEADSALGAATVAREMRRRAAERELVDLNGSDVVCVVSDDELSIIQDGDEEIRLGPDGVHALLEEIASSPALRSDLADVWEAAVLADRVKDSQ